MALLMSIFAPFINQIVDRLADRVLEITATKEPKFYDRKETAERLHITLPTLHRMTKDGLILAKRVGSRVLYDAEAIDQAVSDNLKYRRVKK